MDPHQFIDLFLHLDKHLDAIIAQYGTWTYALLCLILFCETGLVVTPFLPGDSLLFAAGAVAVESKLSLGTLFPLLLIAVICGDNVNYWIGYFIGNRLPFLNQSHLERTHEFFERHGTKAVIYARFAPIIRTCTPFVAGVGRMSYARFLQFSVIGCLLWLSVCLFAGYFFGNLPFVRGHFSIVVLGIIAVSLIPAVLEFLKHRQGKQ
jgi:membrane-associated protein